MSDAITATDVFAYLEQTFDGHFKEPLGDIRWLYFSDAGGEAAMMLELVESAEAVTLKSVLVNPRGGGHGTCLLEALRDYADLREKTLRIEDIENGAFFERFDFWTEYWAADPDEFLDGEAVYRPAGVDED